MIQSEPKSQLLTCKMCRTHRLASKLSQDLNEMRDKVLGTIMDSTYSVPFLPNNISSHFIGPFCVIICA